MGLLAAFALIRKSRVGLVLIERRVANDAAFADGLVGLKRVVSVALAAHHLRPVILEVALGNRQSPLAFHLLQRSSGVERRPRWPNQVGIEARARTHASRKLASVSEVDRHRVVRMARRYNNRRFHSLVAHRQLDDVVFFQTQPGQRGARHNRGVVPAQIRDGLGQFLQPTHVRPSPVIDIRIRPEDDFDRILRRGCGDLGLRTRTATLSRLVECGVLNPSGVQRLAPARLEVALDRRLPRLAHSLIRAQLRLVQQRLENVMRCLAAIERLNQRLHNRHRAVIRPRVRPRLQRVRRRNVPVRFVSSLVVMRTQMCNYLCLIERCRKLQIRGSRVDGVGVQNHQPIHLARVEISHQRLQVANLIAGQRVQRVANNHRLAHVAQCGIDGQSQLSHRWILVDAGNHRALARVRLQVLREGRKKLLLLIGPAVIRSLRAGRAHRYGKRRGKRRNLARAQSQPMFGLHAGRRRRALHRVQPVQIAGRLAPLRIFAGQLVEARKRRA